MEEAGTRFCGVTSAILVHLGIAREESGPLPIVDDAVRGGLVEAAAALVDIAWWSEEARHLLEQGLFPHAAIALRSLAVSLDDAKLSGGREMVGLMHGIVAARSVQPWHADMCERVLEQALGIDIEDVAGLERGRAA